MAGVAVDDKFRIHGHQLSVHQPQGIDFHQKGARLEKCMLYLLYHGTQILLVFYPKPFCQILQLISLQARKGIDFHPDNFLRILTGYRLNVHASHPAGDQSRLRHSLQGDGQIQLFFCLHHLFGQKAVYLVPLNLHVQNIMGIFPVVRLVPADLDSACFPPAPCHHLGFQHERISHGRRLIFTGNQMTLRYGNPIVPHQLFPFIFK